MSVHNKNLKNEMKQKIMDKFGQNISLTELYETILRRMVYDIKANLNETTMQFNKRINGEFKYILVRFNSLIYSLCRVFYYIIAEIKECYAEELITFSNMIREHTQKLSFLTLLVEEQSKLKKLLRRHITSDVNNVYISSSCLYSHLYSFFKLSFNEV